jgi:very-short-patch-repair endonuclease
MPADTIAPVERLREGGGIATRGPLLHSCARGELDRAVAAGDIVRVARGRYALAVVDDDARTAARLGGVLCLASAALHHGWAVKSVPDRPHLMFSRGRHLPASEHGAHLHRAELKPHEVADGATTVETTLEHCMRRLPFDEALAIADSALRSGVSRSSLDRIAEDARGPGSPQMRRVARRASPKAANPFESVLRAIALDVAGLAVRPQVKIWEPDIVARPDLVDQGLRIVLEADSFQWHGGRAQLSSDARRYDLLVVNGWIVLRFSYEHVMLQPDFVGRVLARGVMLAERMREVGLLAPPAA